MEWLQELLQSTTVAPVTAFVLGLLAAVSPCPFATNITAIGYISRDIESRHRIFCSGLLYTLGRIVAYGGLGFILIPILRQGTSIYAIQRVIAEYGEMILAPSLITIGLFMLFGSRLGAGLAKFGFNPSGEGLKNRGGWGAFALGVLFSLAFCPSSGVFYFGMLMPLSAAQSGGYMLPIIFAVATGVPVIVVAWVLAYSVAGLGRFYCRIQILQRWMNLVVALLFIIIGVYYLIMLWL